MQVLSWYLLFSLQFPIENCDQDFFLFILAIIFYNSAELPKPEGIWRFRLMNACTTIWMTFCICWCVSALALGNTSVPLWQCYTTENTDLLLQWAPALEIIFYFDGKEHSRIIGRWVFTSPSLCLLWISSSSAAVLGVRLSCSNWTTHGIALSVTGFTGGFTLSSCKPSLISQPLERCWVSVLLTFSPCSSPIHQWGWWGPARGGDCAGEQGGSHGVHSHWEPFPKDHLAEGWPAPGRGWQTHIAVQWKEVTGSVIFFIVEKLGFGYKKRSGFAE